MHPVYGVAPSYHYEVFRILCGFGLAVIPRRSLGDLWTEGNNVDYVFSLYNRAPFRGCEVFTSVVCEFLGLPYLGALPHVRSIAEDKHLTKVLASWLGIPTAPWITYRTFECDLQAPPFAGPYLAKPRCGAGSGGITESSVQDEWGALRPRVQTLLEKGRDVIVESFIEGQDVTVAVIGGTTPTVLPPIAVRSTLRGGVVTNAQKRLLVPGLSRTPYREQGRVRSLRRFAKILWREVEPLDYARFDFRVPDDPTKPVILLEFNICCNLGSHASMVHAAMEAGLTHADLVRQILQHSFTRQQIRWKGF